MPPPPPPAFRDIRGIGFSRRVRLSVALPLLLGRCAPPGTETVPLAAANGRCLVADLPLVLPVRASKLARRNGVALRAELTYGASTYDPIILPETEVHAYSTGEPLPAGVDAVLPFGSLRHADGFIEVLGPVAPGDGVQILEPVAQPTTTTLPAGQLLTPALLALLAGGGIGEVVVYRRPRVRLIAVGGARSGPADQLTAALTAALIRDGAELTEVLRPPLDIDQVAHAIAAPGCDLVLSAGRTGSGPDDIAPPALAQAGHVLAHGLALRPGGSAAVGFAASHPVILLPGQPPSALTAYAMLGAPALAKLSGRHPLPGARPLRTTLLGRKLISEPGMLDVAPVRIDADGMAFPLGDPSQLDLSSLTAEGVVLVAEDSEGLPAGSEVVIYSLDGPLAGGEDNG